MTRLTPGVARLLFAAMAYAYFLSTLIRAITATIAPSLVQELALNARDLGLLAGGYFLGFALTQLPMGSWLDRYGPKRVELVFLSIAVLGCIAFSQSHSFVGLLLSRVVCGIGVSACLMAPLTGYRRWFGPDLQTRAGAWMLMVGSLGMVAATLPVQWLLPITGWRNIFLGLGGLVLTSMALIGWLLPAWTSPADPHPSAMATEPGLLARYRPVFTSRYFKRLMPLGFFAYGGLIAMQTLWAGPWMVRVASYTPAEAAQGLFWINVAMLIAYWLWGAVSPWLARKSISQEQVIAGVLPLSLALLCVLAVGGGSLGKYTALCWVLFSVSSTAVTQLLPVIGMAFLPEMAGRAMSAYNLVVFSGIFALQWGMGLAIDGLTAFGLNVVKSYQGALGIYAALSAASYIFFLLYRTQDKSQKP